MDSKYFVTSAFLDDFEADNGVSFDAFCSPSFAPHDSRARAIDTFLIRAHRCRDVLPALFAAFGSLPSRRSTRIVCS
jgi:hypothetical protein